MVAFSNGSTDNVLILVATHVQFYLHNRHTYNLVVKGTYATEASKQLTNIPQDRSPTPHNMQSTIRDQQPDATTTVDACHSSSNYKLNWSADLVY